ncbi:MAG TPA: response regulator [Candidatus Sumerlaeota bacterium]|nr:response regulator [Candidatus Sumerlaeota bacterium]
MSACILVVDDFDDAREALGAILDNAGYRVVLAGAPSQALDMLRLHEVDVVVCDIKLPEMSGLDLLPRIKKDFQNIQVILITGQPTVESAADALRMGAFDYLCKPVPTAALQRSVGNALRHKVLADEKRRLEEENLKYQAHLEKLVKMRTEALQIKQDELQKSQLLYQAILRSTPHGLCMLTPTWNMTFANHAMSMILIPDPGVTRELLGLSLGSLFEDQKTFLEYSRAALNEMRTKGIDVRDMELNRLNGEPFWCEISIVRHDPTATASGFVATLTDITERKTYEKALLRKTRDLNERIRELNCLHQISEFLMSPDLSLDKILEGVARLIPFGFRQPEMICVRLVVNEMEYATKNFRKTSRSNSWNILSGGEKIGMLDIVSLEESANGGEQPFLEYEIQMIMTVIKTLGMIISQKREEEARKMTEQALEQQRVLRMRSDRLRSLGQMATGIAHELNQPLVGVRGLAEHLMIAMDRKWDLPPENIHEKLRLIIEQADRMTHIINHVRTFARDAGKPETQPVRINDVARSAMDLLGSQFKSHGMTLESELTETEAEVLANPFSLEEVLLNLIINARDAVEERLSDRWDSSLSSVKIRTSVEEQPEGAIAVIEVIDQGIGIPRDVLERVFDPFFTTKSPDKGTGLGLAISRSIIEQFNGTIAIQSEPWEGTTIAIRLPLKGVPANASE